MSKHYAQIRLGAPGAPSAATAAVTDALDTGSVAATDQVRAFESAYASFCGADDAVATTSPAAAMQAALAAVGVGEGDRVLAPASAPTATATAIRAVGATRLVADIDPETYTLDPGAAEQRLRGDESVDALVVTHRHGLAANLAPLRELAAEHGLALIEDVAGAHGARYRGEPVGGLGDVSCVSFAPGSPVTTGQGGMVLADSEGVIDRAHQYVATGRVETPTSERTASREQFRMGELAAALGRRQLDRLPGAIQARQQNATRLRRQLADTDLVTPFEPGYATHSYSRFVVRCERRDALKEHLDEFGIESTVPGAGPGRGRARDAAEAAEAVLALPVHSQLSRREIDTVGEAVTYFDSFV
jgi:dTDP-4-amino-4,6-dideoxygalactose transaminase